MTTTGLPEITADYTAALRDYLAGAQESALVHAYEIIRRAIEGDLGLLDVMAAHQTALAAPLEAEARDGTARTVAASMAFLAESLAPFEMAQRGYRAATEAAVRAREEAERASMAKSDFLSRVSHELRTPFNAVLGFAQVLEMEDLTPDQLESVEQIILAGRHLLALIDEVLDISRIESGTLSLSVEPVELNHLVAETVDLVRGMAATRSIQLGVDRDAVAGDTYLLADRQRLKQVLLNLLSNAVKYNREGGAAILSLRRDGDAVLIEVADGGPGIPEDRIDRLFSPFERLGAEQSEVEGTGLGLALSKRLVEAMEERSGSRPPRPRGRRSSSACPMRRPQRAPSSPRRTRPELRPTRRDHREPCCTWRTTYPTSRSWSASCRTAPRSRSSRPCRAGWGRSSPRSTGPTSSCSTSTFPTSPAKRSCEG
jgi:signal transduction histidine kinase